MSDENQQVIDTAQDDIQVTRLQKAGLILAAFVVLTILFYVAPPETGFDWFLILSGSERLLAGEEIYARISYYGYYYAPWLTVLLTPFVPLPETVSFAMLNAITWIGAFLLAQRYQLGLVRTLLLMTSPPIFYALILGQVDVLVLLLLFLPKELWAIAALTKPQVTIGMGFALLKRFNIWLRTIVISLIIMGLSFLAFGNWIAKILALQELESNETAAHNIFAGLWPFQAIVGIVLLSIAFEKDDERIYIAASPFLLPYAATSSLVGLLLSVFSFIRSWQAVLLWGAWWGAIAYRAVVIA